MRHIVTAHGFTIANLNYRLDGDEDFFEYRMVIRTRNPANARTLTETLSGLPAVRDFRISPTGD